MIKKKYIDFLKVTARKYFPESTNKVFVFGSVLFREKFKDIDLGVAGEIDEKKLIALKEELEDSTFPYFVDVVNFNLVEKDFKDHVFSYDKIIWL